MVEALHFFQRVFAVNVAVVRLPYAFPNARVALEQLGLTVIGELCASNVHCVTIDDLCLDDLSTFLQTLRKNAQRCVTITALLDDIY